MTLYRNILAFVATFAFGAAALVSASANYVGSGGVTWLALGLMVYALRGVSLTR